MALRLDAPSPELRGPPEAAANPAGPILAGNDLDDLLAPIPGPGACGVDLRYAGDYDQIREAQRDDDPSLPRGVWQRQLQRADWDEVARLCADALTHRSKDLQLAAWLIEAALHRGGVSTLASGFVLLERLCALYWDGLFPALDGDDVEARLAPFDWLNTHLPVLLHQMPITQAGGAPPVSRSWADYRNAERHEVIRQRDPQAAAKAEAAGRVTLQSFIDHVARTPNSFYLPLHAELSAATRRLDRLAAQLSDLCGRLAPSLSGLHEAIAALEGWVGGILLERNALPADAVALDPDQSAETWPEDVAADAAPADRTIRSRDEAYRRLSEVAEYLFRTEPHSPTPYLVQRAVTWGRLPLHELLPELARHGDLKHVFDLLGFPH